MLTYEKYTHRLTSQLRFGLEVILLKNKYFQLVGYQSHKKSGFKLCHWHMVVLYSVVMSADSDSDIYFALNNYPRVQGGKNLELYV